MRESILERVFGKKTVKDIAPDELSTEKIKLSEEEKRIVSRIERLEEQKAKLFKEGVGEPSKRRKAIIARKIKEIDERVKELDRDHRETSKKIRTVDRLKRVREREDRLKEKGLWGTIARMTPAELEKYLIGEEAEKAGEKTRISEILEVLEEGAESYEGLEEEEDIKKIIEKMEEAGESGEIEEKYEELDKVVLKEEF